MPRIIDPKDGRSDWGFADWPRDERNPIGGFDLLSVLKGAGVEATLYPYPMAMRAEYQLRCDPELFLVIAIFPTAQRAHEQLLCTMRRVSGGQVERRLSDGGKVGDVMFSLGGGVSVAFVRRNAFVELSHGFVDARPYPAGTAKVAKALDRALASAPARAPGQPDPIPAIKVRTPLPDRMIEGEDAVVELAVSARADLLGVGAPYWVGERMEVKRLGDEAGAGRFRFRVRAGRVGKSTLEFLAADKNGMTGVLYVNAEVVPKGKPVGDAPHR